jgi:phosphatidylglycerol:prolipoprotein diacylglycerol transferase
MTLLSTLLSIPFPNIDPVAIRIGPLAVKWYGLAYLAGFLLGWVYIRRLCEEARLWPGGKAPLTRLQVDDLVLYVVLGVVVGGRLGHVLLYEPGYYLSHLLEIPAVWKGGMSFHGGLAGTGVAMLLFAWRNGLVALSVMDLVAAAVPFGLFFGRVANFVNAEIVGSPTSLPWGMVFPHDGPLPRHPAMLYEAALEGIALFFILRFFTHRRLALTTPGRVTGWFLVCYGLFRIFAELFKITPERLFTPAVPITKGMVYSVPMLLLGLWFLHLARSRAERKAAAGS